MDGIMPIVLYFSLLVFPECCYDSVCAVEVGGASPPLRHRCSYSVPARASRHQASHLPAPLTGSTYPDVADTIRTPSDESHLAISPSSSGDVPRNGASSGRTVSAAAVMASTTGIG